MISRTKTRIKIRQALDLLDPERKTINWPMVKFRHLIFEVVDRCKLIQDVVWRFDTVNQFTICVLKFPSKEIILTYNYQNDTVKISDPYSNWMDTVNIAEVVEIVKVRQPKVKIVIKRKE